MAAEAKARSSDLARGLAAGASVGAAQRSASARRRLLGHAGVISAGLVSYRVGFVGLGFGSRSFWVVSLR